MNLMPDMQQQFKDTRHGSPSRLGIEYMDEHGISCNDECHVEWDKILDILNNVYMDLRGKKPVFKRTKTAMERNNIFATIRRYAKKLKPQYNGDVYLETVRCYFDIPQENLEKCRYTYQGNETYAFLMSDKYIMALYTHCLVARREAAVQGIHIEGFTDREYEMVRLENV